MWLQSGPCEQMWHHCIANFQRLVSSNALSCKKRKRQHGLPWQMICHQVLSQHPRFTHWPKGFTDHQLYWQEATMSTMPTLPYISLLTGWYPSAMHMHVICNTQSKNAIHHHDQTLLSSEPLPVWHSQVPEQHPKPWAWIKLPTQSNPTDTKVLVENQKQRRL